LTVASGATALGSVTIRSSRVLFRRSSILSIDSDRVGLAERQEHYMLQRISLLVCVVCAIVLVGCSKSEPTSNTGTTGNANRAATTTTPATTTTAGTAAKIGVPECDEFLAAYDACVSSKVPEVARAQYKTAIEQWRSSWRKLAENPQTKPTLTAACKQSAEQARTSMKAYGCTF
jgi:hypothetical protein